jgi:hypothetical protein
MQQEDQPGGKAESAATLNKYGFTEEEWAALDTGNKRRAYAKVARIKSRALNPEAFAERERAKDQRRRHRDIQAARRRGRERYHRTREAKRLQASASYYRNHDKQLARHRAKRARKESLAQVRCSPDVVYKLVTKAIPGGLPRHDRDDLAGAMCLAILEGKLLVKHIKAEVAKYLKAHNREYDTFKTLSLDAEIPGTKTRYVDNIASDAVHF